MRIADTVADLVDFWRARDEANVDATYADGGYSGTVTTGAHAAQNLTLEFGDVISSFACPSCGAVEFSGKRVSLRASLAPMTTFAFRALVGAAPPTVPAVPSPWRAALIVVLTIAGACVAGRRAIAIAVVAGLLCSSRASAEPSSYCAEVRERAADDAALLMGPRLTVQGLRFPDNGQLEGGTVIGKGFQARAGLTFSATDLYKGVGLLRVGDADCRERDARVQLEAAIRDGDEDARQAALGAQIAFLEAHRQEIRVWVDKAIARFSARVITLVELEDVRARVGALELKIVQARGQQRALDARFPLAGRGSAASANQLASSHATAAADLDRATASVRAAEPWALEVTGGIIPFPRADWYGIVQLGYSVGGLTRPGHAKRYAQARQDEREHAPYELEERRRRSEAVRDALLDQGRLELALTEHELADLHDVRRVLESSEAPEAVQERDKLSIEQIALEADRVFHRAYVDSLSAALERN